jgi:hypothetical protein
MISGYAESLANEAKAIAEQSDENEKHIMAERVRCEYLFKEISEEERDHILSLLK